MWAIVIWRLMQHLLLNGFIHEYIVESTRTVIGDKNVEFLKKSSLFPEMTPLRTPLPLVRVRWRVRS